MNVKLLAEYGEAKAGSEIELPKHIAEALIAAGFAKASKNTTPKGND